MHNVFCFICSKHLIYDCPYQYILTLKTPFHAMQIEIYHLSKKYRITFQVISLLFYNSPMENLLWVTDYTHSYFIDSDTSAFSV